jgi:hypothetical protein
MHAHKLKVAALLDSDNAGAQVAKLDVLVHTLGHKAILRTSDYTIPKIENAEIEDLLRTTLPIVAKEHLLLDVTAKVAKVPLRLVGVFEAEAKDFSRYRLAKAFLRWSRDHTADDLSEVERKQWSALIGAINSALK